MELVVATTNEHKLQELRKILPESFKIKGLKDFGFAGDIPETGSTFRENALRKARFLYEKFHVDCLADDSGLEVSALGGRPGVYSARYAGPGASSGDNVDKLLAEMKGVTNRQAKFVTVLALIFKGKEAVFEGEIKGLIADKPAGINGFGYDPVFIPENGGATFAEMSAADKNRISHRAIAAGKLRAYLANRLEL